MEMILLEITHGEKELIEKALRAYHYHLVYQCRSAKENKKDFPHPIDTYLSKEAESTESILINVFKK